jgi:hypothetical protein
MSFGERRREAIGLALWSRSGEHERGFQPKEKKYKPPSAKSRFIGSQVK